MSDGPICLSFLCARQLSDLSINAIPAANISVREIIWTASNQNMEILLHLGYDFNSSEVTSDGHLAYDEDEEQDTFNNEGNSFV